jgi:peroxiredoxin
MSNDSDLVIGSLAPRFSLPASNGIEIELVSFRSKINVYLFFVREFN